MDFENCKEPTIKEFFRGKNIFITGASGFLGKVLIEKLLHSCPDIGTIYVLLRAKKGKTMKERTKELFNSVIFDKLEGPWREHLKEVEGEMGAADLGLSKSSQELLTDNVEVVFHCAATVRFDEKLNDAININVRGTADIMSLCKKMKKLKSMMYVSTAFSHCNRTTQGIDEEFYPPGMSPKSALALADLEDSEPLHVMTPKLLKGWPNTYTFTKAIAEELVRQESAGLPVGVFRPAVVVGNTAASTHPGYVDNMFGPTGFVLGIGYGILRTIYTPDLTLAAEFIPADLCINGLIAAAWRVGIQKFDTPPVYNFTPDPENELIFYEVLEDGLEYGHTVPIPECMWYNCLTFTDNKAWFKILWFFYHVIPAFFIDTYLVTKGEKPKMTQAYKKINKFIDAVEHFGHIRWKFGRRNIKELSQSLRLEDRETFAFDMANVNWKEHIKNMIDGIRLYLVKQTTDNLEECRERYFKLKILHYTIKYFLMFLAVYFLWYVMQLVLRASSLQGSA